MKTIRPHIHKKGFTIIEALTAVVVLSIVTAAAFSAATSGLRTLYNARDRTTAFFLAQEGAEFVKNWRDHNVLSAPLDDWNKGFSVCSGGCWVDAPNNISDPCTGDACRLRTNPNNPAPYLYRGGPYGTAATRFSRQVSIESPFGGDPNAAKVTSYVKWDGLGEGDLELVEYIYNQKGILQ